MPYIVTTSNQVCFDGIKHLRPLPGSVTRRAVASLDEANDATLDARRAMYWPIGRPRRVGQPSRIGPDGGTVGPLPDGTTITVEKVDEQSLIVLARQLAPDDDRLVECGTYGETAAAVPFAIAAYNAAQEN